MSYMNRVYTALRPGQVHNDHEIAAITQLPVKDVKECLKLLEKGNLIEFLSETKFKRKKIIAYTTKQRRLF